MNAIIVQARMGSKRLKDKTLLPLAGKPMIYRIIERLKRVKNVKKIIFLRVSQSLSSHQIYPIYLKTVIQTELELKFLDLIFWMI